MPVPSIESIVDDLSFLDDWEDRYRYLIDLGRMLDPLPEDARTDANKVRGCVSQVWLDTQVASQDGKTILTFRGDSDAHIVRGLVALTLSFYSGKSADEILGEDAGELYRRLGLTSHLTPQRSNGVRAMIERIRTDAQRAPAAAENH